MERQPGKITLAAVRTVDNLARLGERLTPKRFRGDISFEDAGKTVAHGIDRLADLGKKLTSGNRPPKS
jgi:hypothetical protein